MAEEIINALTRIDGLRVAARSSAFSLRNDAADARQIGARLQVKSIVEGSVQRAGERLRVTARLIDATTGYQQWSERWDRDVADVFAIQDEIAVRVAEALKMHLSNAERDAIHSVRPREVGVYELYLRALTFRNAFGSRSQRFAIEMLERALAIDSAYAPAWAALATCHVLLYLYAEASEEHRIKASDASARAIALDPLSAEAHTSSGCAATLRGEFGAAEQAFRRAQALNPRLFEAWYYHARCCASLGAHERAVQLYERAAQTRPEDYEAWNMAVQSWRSLGQPVQAERAARRCVAAAERALTLDPGDVRGLCLGAGALALLGQAELARSWTEQALALDPNEAHVLYNAACVYVAIDEHEMAIDCFERMNVAAMANRSWMENDSWLDPLRAHPRFQALLSQAR
jgi:adenylate cyclase